VAKLFLSAVSIILLIIGIIATFTPIPIGLFIIALSLSMLIGVNERAQNYVRNLREKHEHFDVRVQWLETKVGTRVKFVGGALAKTRPEDFHR